MPRNSSGVYSLPQAAFVPNSVISSSAVNSNFSDIAVAITGSLPVNGSTGMTGQFLSTSGNVGAPGLAFASDTNTGFYLAGTHQIGWAANGALAATLNSDKSVTWQGNATWGGAVAFNGTSSLTGNVTFNATSYTFGAGATAAFWAGLAAQVDVQIIIDGGGSVITTGQKGQLHIPFPITLQTWRMIADQSGSITVDVLRANLAVPSVSMIGGGTKPVLSSQQINTGGTVGNWNSALLVKDDWIAFNVTGVPSSVQRVTVVLSGIRTDS